MRKEPSNEIPRKHLFSVHCAFYSLRRSTSRVLNLVSLLRSLAKSFISCSGYGGEMPRKSRGDLEATKWVRVQAAVPARPRTLRRGQMNACSNLFPPSQNAYNFIFLFFPTNILHLDLKFSLPHGKIPLFQRETPSRAEMQNITSPPYQTHHLGFKQLDLP